MSEINALEVPTASVARIRQWTLPRLGAQRLRVFLMLAASVLGAAAAVVPAYALGRLIDIARSESGDAIAPIATVIVAAAVIGGLAQAASQYLVTSVGERVVATLREQVMERILGLPSSVVERIGRGDLISRASSDVATIARAVSAVIPTAISSIFLALLSVVAMAGLDWRLGIAGALAMPMYVLALRWYLPRSSPMYANQRKAVGQRSQTTLETITGLKTIRAYGLSRQRYGLVDETSSRARDVSMSTFTVFTRFVGRINRAEFVGLSLILVFGYVLTRHGGVTVGDVAAAALLFHRLFNPISVLLFTFDKAQAAGASFARLVGVLDLPNRSSESGTVPTQLPTFTGAIRARNLSVRYGETVALRDVSIDIAAGTQVALVGASGAGKSTLAAVLAGTVEPDAGTVTLDAENGEVTVGSLSETVVRSAVTLTSQEIHVFAGTIAEDLLLARPEASHADITAALEKSGAATWVRDLPDGRDTVVGEGGHVLTAAHSQQLALARVILADPRIAILDEATAEAGSSGARALEAAADAVAHGRTAIVVAHRLNAAAKADEVIVLDAGEVVQRGPHVTLLEQDGPYARLWAAWEAKTPAAH